MHSPHCQLSLHEVTIGEADPVTDPELLMTIMETREELEEAEQEEDVSRIRDRNRGESFSPRDGRTCSSARKPLADGKSASPQRAGNASSTRSRPHSRLRSPTSRRPGISSSSCDTWTTSSRCAGNGSRASGSSCSIERRDLAGTCKTSLPLHRVAALSLSR